MSRFSRIIDTLETIDAADRRNAARVFGVTAELYTKLETIVNGNKTLSPSGQKALKGSMSKEQLLTLRADLVSKLAEVDALLGQFDT